MVVRFAGTSNIKGWLGGWKKRVRELEQKKQLTPGQVAEYGAKYAKTIAPHDTYALIQSISWKNQGNGRTVTAMVWVRPVSNPLGGVTTRYGSVMHKTPIGAASKIWKSGDPHFMFTTRERVREKFRSSVLTHIRKFIGKK